MSPDEPSVDSERIYLLGILGQPTPEGNLKEQVAR
jgi:hypothetical protein